MTLRDLQAHPTDRHVEVNEVLSMIVTMYRKKKGTYINKVINMRLRATIQGKVTNIGKVVVDIRDFTKLPIHHAEFPISKCSDDNATICLSINAVPAEGAPPPEAPVEHTPEPDELVLQLEELRGRMEELNLDIENSQKIAAKQTDRLQELRSELNAAVEANSAEHAEVEHLTSELEKLRSVAEHKKSRLIMFKEAKERSPEEEAELVRKHIADLTEKRNELLEER